VEKDQISRMDGGAIVNPPMFDHMGKDAPDAVAAIKLAEPTIQVHQLRGVDASNKA
jgi:hypothetical protein